MDDRTSRRERRRNRSNGFLDVLNSVLTLVVLALVLAGAVFLYVAHDFYSGSTVAEDTTFAVEKGAGLSLTAQRLESQGLIANRLIFQAASWALKKRGELRPGEFRIPKGATEADILKLLTEGDPIPYFVTVPEGETSFQVAQRINDPAQNLTGDPVPVPPEGSVLPGRYDYLPHDTRQSVLQQMQKRMTEKRDTVWKNCSPNVCGPNAPLKTPDQLVTLASIVEKETGLPSERPEVAGLFVNRLRTGMRLQTDPTIIYGITRGQRQLEGGITARQKATETPYNTYLIAGLPPTPIANPGTEALEAVANPAATKNLYMMAVTPGNPKDGHLFADTLAEHQANEAKYRAQEREQARAGEGGNAAAPRNDTAAPAPANAAAPPAAPGNDAAAVPKNETPAAAPPNSAAGAQGAPANTQ